MEAVVMDPMEAINLAVAEVEGDADPIWREDPVNFKTFTEHEDHMGGPALSERQLNACIKFLGEDPKKIFEGGSRFSIAVLLWGKGCLTGDSKIVDEDTKKEYTIEQLMKEEKEIRTRCYDEKNGEEVIDKVSAPWLKGEEEIFEVVLDTGQKIKVSKAHKFLTKNGWKELGEVKEGDEILAEDRVVCQLCGLSLKHMTKTHLIRHKIDICEYKKMYPWQRLSSFEHRQACSRKGIKHGMFGKNHTKESNEKNRLNNSKSFDMRYGERADEERRKRAVFGEKNWVNDPVEQMIMIQKKKKDGTYEDWAVKMKKTGGYSNGHHLRYRYISKYAGEIVVVANYERRMCLVLDKACNMGTFLKWEYTKDKVGYESNGKRNYYPDFKVWLEDGMWFYIETKGWMDESCVEKMKIVSKLVPVKLVQDKELKQMEAIYAIR